MRCATSDRHPAPFLADLNRVDGANLQRILGVQMLEAVDHDGARLALPGRVAHRFGQPDPCQQLINGNCAVGSQLFRQRHGFDVRRNFSLPHNPREFLFGGPGLGVRVKVPKKLQDLAGNTHIRRTLGTRNLGKANELKWGHVKASLSFRLRA